jgi:hypothetical protein
MHAPVVGTKGGNNKAKTPPTVSREDLLEDSMGLTCIL